MTKPNVLILAITGASALRKTGDSNVYHTKHDELLHRFSPRPMGAFQVAHHLRIHGFTCQVIAHLSEFTTEELIEIVDSTIDSNTIIGVSHVFPDAAKFSYVVKILEHIREKFPNNKIVIGGNNVLGTQFKFDAYFKGYSEDAFLEYVEAQYGRRNQRIFTSLLQGSPVIDSDDCMEHRFEIEQLDHRWTDEDAIINGEILPIEISRGCIFKCTFCGYRLNGKKKFDYVRDPERVAAEMLYNYERWGITKYQFMDDTLNDTTFKIQGLHDAFAKLPFKPQFLAYIRADLLHAHPEQITLLKNMGLISAFFGLETFNQESATSVGKGLKIEKLKALLDSLYHEHWKDIGVVAGFVAGLPYETIESLTATIEWQLQHPKWSFTNVPLIMLESSDNISILCAESEKYGYTWFRDHTTHPEWEQTKVKHFWVNNVGVSEHEVFKLLRENLVGFKSPTFALPQQFFYSGFSKRDLTNQPKEQLSEQLLYDYSKFIAKYKGKIWDISKVR